MCACLLASSQLTFKGFEKGWGEIRKAQAFTIALGMLEEKSIVCTQELSLKLLLARSTMLV